MLHQAIKNCFLLVLLNQTRKSDAKNVLLFTWGSRLEVAYGEVGTVSPLPHVRSRDALGNIAISVT